MGRSVRGFTLLEMLVAIAIFALVAVMAHTGLRSVLKNRDHVEQQSEYLQQLQMAMLMIGRDLAQANGRTIRDEYGDYQPALRSAAFGEVRLEFTRDGWRNPTGQPRSELQRVAYGIQDERLMRWHWQVLDRAQDSEPYPTRLLDGVEGLRLRFLDGAREWQEVWPPEAAPEALPLAVELELELRGQGSIRRLLLLSENPRRPWQAAPPDGEAPPEGEEDEGT